MRGSVSFLILIFGVFVFANSTTASECKSSIARLSALTSTILFFSPAKAAVFSPPSWPSRELQITPWPFKNLRDGFEISEPTADLRLQIDQAHQGYQNFVYYEGISNVYDPAFYLADAYRNEKLGPQWLAVDGGWKSVEILAPKDMPVGSPYGIQLFLDSTPHTPGLYQFTTVSWANWPFTITVTHYAWVIKTPSNLDRPDFAIEPSVTHYQIPSPSTFASLGIGSWALVRRQRRSGH